MFESSGYAMSSPEDVPGLAGVKVSHAYVFGCLETVGNYMDYEGGYATVVVSDALADGSVRVNGMDAACAVLEGHFVPESLSDLSEVCE